LSPQYTAHRQGSPEEAEGARLSEVEGLSMKKPHILENIMFMPFG
jgi:hypothetical protein